MDPTGLLTTKKTYKWIIKYVAACSRSITKMKAANEGAGGMPKEGNDRDFQVVPVESTSEYMKH